MNCAVRLCVCAHELSGALFSIGCVFVCETQVPSDGRFHHSIGVRCLCLPCGAFVVLYLVKRKTKEEGRRRHTETKDNER